MIGTRHECLCCGRVARITAAYDDGFEYHFEGEGLGTRWIRCEDAVIRFRRVGDDAVGVVAKLRESIDGALR